MKKILFTCTLLMATTGASFAGVDDFGAVPSVSPEALLGAPALPPAPGVNLPMNMPSASTPNLSPFTSLKPVNYAQQEVKLENAILQLDAAQVEVKKQYTQTKTQYTEIDRQYKLIKNERKKANKQMKKLNKKIKSIEGAKKNIRKNFEVQKNAVNAAF